MRIGTWNIENRLITSRHKDLILGEDCDVWLLTEVNRRWLSEDGRIEELPGFHCHPSRELMGRNQHWAVILSRRPFSDLPEDRLDDPHPASTAAIVSGITFCATILPWKGSGGEHPWSGENHSSRTHATLETLLKNLPASNLVWGGDWNHSLFGTEIAGSIGGRNHLLSALKKLKLQVPTAGLTHRGNFCHAIDHIAVPLEWNVRFAKRIIANGLSDHDAYVIDVDIPDEQSGP